jgi:hypothetical protein
VFLRFVRVVVPEGLFHWLTMPQFIQLRLTDIWIISSSGLL